MEAFFFLLLLLLFLSLPLFNGLITMPHSAISHFACRCLEHSTLLKFLKLRSKGWVSPPNSFQSYLCSPQEQLLSVCYCPAHSEPPCLNRWHSKQSCYWYHYDYHCSSSMAPLPQTMRVASSICPLSHSPWYPGQTGPWWAPYAPYCQNSINFNSVSFKNSAASISEL